MGDMMTFPASVEEFMEQYKMTDTEHVYSNGTEYVPIYRMKQWFEHCRNQQLLTIQPGQKTLGNIADYRISNGVTVQDWISIDDRLPEEDGEYLVWFGKSAFGQYAKVIGFAKDGDTVDKYDLHNEKNVWFYYDSECGYLACRDVTHWMQIPHPPKGE